MTAKAYRQRIGGFFPNVLMVLMGVMITSCQVLSKSSTSSTDAGCVSTQAYFSKNVWAPVMGKSCVSCHTPDGQAGIKNAKLILLSSSNPGFLETNLANVREVAKIEYEGRSELLQKPLGKMGHGGGQVLTEGSPEYQALADFVARLNQPDTCADADPGAKFVGVTQLDGPGTLRKAAIHLAGRLPTPEETAAVADNADASLDAGINKLLEEPAFYERLKEIYNDLLLTDRYLLDLNDGCSNSGGLNLLRAEDYSDRFIHTKTLDCCNDKSPAYLSDACVSAKSAQAIAANAVAREPLNLVAYVAKNNRPFSEILTANYVLVNAQSAKSYGVSGNVQFANPNDPDEVHEAQITFVRPAQDKTPAQRISLPHAGLLTTPAFLNAFPTTPTNINRGRSRVVQKFFLATDILKIAERPIDATAVTGTVINPTLNSDTCTVCHKIVDPVAGAFQKWDANDQDKYVPDAEWRTDVFPPGFGGQNMEPGAYPRALQWLAPRIGADPRFALSVVYTAYAALTGHKLLPYPTDTSDPLFDAHLTAWQTQDSFFRQVSADFVANNYNVKTVFKEIVTSIYFRAVAGPPGLDDAGKAELTDVGTGRLLTPEMLSRKLRTITGYAWLDNDPRYNVNAAKDGHDRLLFDYRIAYGGIDSESVFIRTTTANGLIANIGWRLANDFACRDTAWDFAKAKEQRRFFPTVELDTVPEAGGNPVPANIDTIKQTIQHLHALLLGENLTVDDPEIERTFQLFLETWREINQAKDPGSLPASCRLLQDKDHPLVGGLAPITEDKTGTIRAWMAVYAYLLADYKFLYE